jgi:hypothetical protein
MRFLFILRLAILALFLGSFGVAAQASASRLCDAAAQDAARQTGVPMAILRAITLAETGHESAETAQFGAWPWALQAEGRGHWFPDQSTAVAYAKALVAQGKSNIDIGCFQLNIRWHSDAFRSLEEMFSPQSNAIYAATFLNQLYRETGDWRAAVGRYHSRNADLAETYLTRLETLFEHHLARPAAATPPDVARAPAVRQPQRFGLISARGPLIQVAGQARPLIGGAP